MVYKISENCEKKCKSVFPKTQDDILNYLVYLVNQKINTFKKLETD